MSRAPASQRAEESLLGALMRSEEVRTQVISSGLEAEHWHYRMFQAAYVEIVERFYGDDPIDPLTIAEAVGPVAAKGWRIEEREAVDRIIALAKIDSSDETSALEHAKIVKRHSDYRELLSIASSAVNEALEQDREPEDIAGKLSAAATRIITGSLANAELISYADLGRRFTRHTLEEIAAKESGQELGAYFGIHGIDSFVKGMRPTELMMLGGNPGVGKSAIAWAMARNFSLRQLAKPTERRIGTLVMSLEMGEELSSGRFAQMESGIEGERLRTTSITKQELRAVAQKWAAHRDAPLWVNHSSELRESQLRAIVVDSIRRHNVGLLIIDHFRFIKTDERFENKTDADEQIVRFLKATLAKDLNLAVICLAHTTKGEDRRPVMDDLRGSKMISAFADLVCFPYSPWKGATQEKRESALVDRFDLEMIFDKVRQGAGGTGELYVDLSTMAVR